MCKQMAPEIYSMKYFLQIYSPNLYLLSYPLMDLFGSKFRDRLIYTLMDPLTTTLLDMLLDLIRYTIRD